MGEKYTHLRQFFLRSQAKTRRKCLSVLCALLHSLEKRVTKASSEVRLKGKSGPPDSFPLRLRMAANVNVSTFFLNSEGFCNSRRTKRIWLSTVCAVPCCVFSKQCKIQKVNCPVHVYKTLQNCKNHRTCNAVDWPVRLQLSSVSKTLDQNQNNLLSII